MNPKGHSKSLVPAQPGNLNAAKTGVFSERLLAPLVAEAEAALAEQRPEDTVEEVLRHEIAALVVLAQAMDASLEQEGIRGRTGEPRSLIDRRLRVNDRLRHTLSQYIDAAQLTVGAPTLVADASDAENVAPDGEPTSLIETIAEFHFRDNIALLQPADVDPEAFLRAVVLTKDPDVTDDDRLLAQRLLNRWKKHRAEYCVCSATLVPRDESEFRQWISDAKADGTQPSSSADAYIAMLVRRVASGERLEPWSSHQRTWYAIEETIQAGVKRVQEETPRRDDRAEGGDDAVIRRSWKTLLSPSLRMKPRQRLKTFKMLDETGVLPQCKCDRTIEQLLEFKADRFRAYVIRIVGQRHYRAALVIARFPETYHTVRDAIDAKVPLDRTEAPGETDAEAT